MKRIIAIWVKEEGFNEIGDRDVDLDVYDREVCRSIKSAAKMINDHEINGVGVIEIQELKSFSYNLAGSGCSKWETVEQISIDEGKILT